MLYTYEPTYETAHNTQQTALRRMEALDLEAGFGNKLLIGSGRAFVRTGQGIKQLG